MITLFRSLFLMLGIACFVTCSSNNTSNNPDINRFFNIETFTHPAGYEVWLVNEPTIPILSINIAWPDGHYYDDDAYYGVSDFVAYLMNEGAGERDSTAFSTELERLNMGFACSAGALWTQCSITLLTERLDESLALIALALSKPRFDLDPIARKKREDVASIQNRETNANFISNEAFKAVYYPNHPLSRNLTNARLDAITQDIITQRYHNIFSRQGVKISVVGNISKGDLSKQLDVLLAGLTPNAEIEDLRPPKEIIIKPKGETSPIIKTLPQPQSLVRAMGPGLKRDDPDFYAAILANQIFGGSATSRLFKSLRTDKGLTYGVYSSISQSEFSANWNIRGQVRNEKAGEFISALKAEMTDLAHNGARQEELDAAKAYLIGSYPLQFDSNAKIASALASAQLEGLPATYFDQRNDLLSRVTLDQVNAVFKTYLAADRFTYVLVGQPEGL